MLLVGMYGTAAGQGLDAEVQILDTEGKTLEVLKMDHAKTGELQAA